MSRPIRGPPHAARGLLWRTGKVIPRGPAARLSQSDKGKSGAGANGDPTNPPTHKWTRRATRFQSTQIRRLSGAGEYNGAFAHRAGLLGSAASGRQISRIKKKAASTLSRDNRYGGTYGYFSRNGAGFGGECVPAPPMMGRMQRGGNQTWRPPAHYDCD